MKALFNTSFFFDPAIEPAVRTALKARWLPACAACGCDEPVCLRMPADDGIGRLAIQTPFPTPAEAERFASEIAAPMAAELTADFGAEAFTAFSTLMEQIEL